MMITPLSFFFYNFLELCFYVKHDAYKLIKYNTTLLKFHHNLKLCYTETLNTNVTT